MNEKVAEKSIEIYKFILSNFYGIIDDEFRKQVSKSMKKSEEIINRRKLEEAKVM
jgi:hypothetical protein